jgi:hypothetical protein
VSLREGFDGDPRQQNAGDAIDPIETWNNFTSLGFENIRFDRHSNDWKKAIDPKLDKG